MEISYHPASKAISPCFAAGLAAGLSRRQDHAGAGAAPALGAHPGFTGLPPSRGAERARPPAPAPLPALSLPPSPSEPPASAPLGTSRRSSRPSPALTAAGPSLPVRARAAAAFSLWRVRHRLLPGGSRRSSPGGRRRREPSARRRAGSAIGSGVATGTAPRRRGAEPGSAGSEPRPAAVTSAPRAVTIFRGVEAGEGPRPAAMAAGGVVRQTLQRFACPPGGRGSDRGGSTARGPGEQLGAAVPGEKKAMGHAAVPLPRRNALCSADGGCRGGARLEFRSLGARMAALRQLESHFLTQGLP